VTLAGERSNRSFYGTVGGNHPMRRSPSGEEAIVAMMALNPDRQGEGEDDWPRWTSSP
jgi:hypothetical protein